MTHSLWFSLATFGLALVAGTFGALFGLGGGIIVVPALTLILGVDVKTAVGTAAVSVIATSSGAATTYLQRGLTNLRVAMFLEVGTVAGALCGAFLAGILDERHLYLAFGVLMAASALALLRKRAVRPALVPPIESGLDLGGVFVEDGGRAVAYQPRRKPLGLVLMFAAGRSSRSRASRCSSPPPSPGWS